MCELEPYRADVFSLTRLAQPKQLLQWTLGGRLRGMTKES